MAILNGCQDGKGTPGLLEVLCPKCKKPMEVFVRMGGEAGQTGRVVSDEKCPVCGYVVKEGTPESELEKA